MDLVKLEPTIDNLRQGVSRISQLLAGQWDPKRDALLRTAEQVNQILMEKEGRDEGETYCLVITCEFSMWKLNAHRPALQQCQHITLIHCWRKAS